MLPAEGTAFVLEGGDAWARIEGQGWHYRLADEAALSEHDEVEPSEG